MRPVAPLDRTDLAQSLRFAEPYIRAALSRSDAAHGFHDVTDALLLGRCRLWIGPNCAAVTHDQVCPQAKLRVIWLAGGDLAELLQLESLIAESAEAEGCDAIEVNGRVGWKPALLEKGYEVASMTFVRALGKRQHGQVLQPSAKSDHDAKH